MKPTLNDYLPERLAFELCRRSLWGAMPRTVQAAPEGPPKLALSFDLDYQADSEALPWITELLDRLDARMTVFSIGKLVEALPEPYREAAAAGHEIANHTWSHPDNPVLNPDQEFWHLSVDEMRREIGQCQDSIEQVVGPRPSSFRTPHFKDAARMLDALAHFPEITCVSTALASKCPVPTPYFPQASAHRHDGGLHFPGTSSGNGNLPLMVPLTPCPGMRWSPFCSYSAIRQPRNPQRGAGLLDCAEWSRRWQTMLERARRRHFASVYFDPIDVARDARTRQTFEHMLAHAIDTGWHLTTTADIEQAWRPVVSAELDAAA